MLFFYPASDPVSECLSREAGSHMMFISYLMDCHSYFKS